MLGKAFLPVFCVSPLCPPQELLSKSRRFYYQPYTFFLLSHFLENCSIILVCFVCLCIVIDFTSTNYVQHWFTSCWWWRIQSSRNWKHHQDSLMMVEVKVMIVDEILTHTLPWKHSCVEIPKWSGLCCCWYQQGVRCCFFGWSSWEYSSYMLQILKHSCWKSKSISSKVFTV